MTKKQFKELIEKAKSEQTEEYGFYGALGGVIYFLRVNNVTLNAEQFETLVDAQIKERFE